MKLQDMMYVALFAAIIGVMGMFPPIAIPFIPVPITLQTLGVMLAGSVLGAKRGFLSLVLFIALVAVGAPMLTGGRGGIGTLVGPGAGYVWAWPFAALLTGYSVEKSWHKLSLFKLVVFNVLGGIIVVYIGGIAYLSFASETPLLETSLANLVFIPGDLTKVVISSYVALKISRVYPLIQISKKEGNIKYKDAA